MKIAVISDIHSNYIALKRCIDYAVERKVDIFIFLGDYLSDLAYPQRTMKMIYDINNSYQCHFIKGNKEEYWLKYSKNGEKGWKSQDFTTGGLLYTYKNLKDRDMEFFKNLPICKKVQLKSMPLITICHGSPRNISEKMLPNKKETIEIIKKTPSSIILCGHTHIQGKIEYHSKKVLNSGSVGVPLESGGKTQFLMLDGADLKWTEEFVSLTYNIERVIKELKESGLNLEAPYWCKTSEIVLRKGEISHATILEKAMSLCEKETGNCVWPHISEKYWERAVNHFML